jgi:hypothetical protein
MNKYKNKIFTIVLAVICSSFGFSGITVHADDSTGSTTTPPAIVLFAPTANTLLNGTTTISAGVTPGTNAITSVQFLLDGTNLGSAVTTADASTGRYLYAWDTTTASNGTHYITGTVTDSAGLTASTPSTSVSVSNSTVVGGVHPTISITAPLSNVSVSGTTTILASVTAGSAAVTKVQFTLDGNNLGAPITTANSGAQYALSWNTATATNGSHRLNAIVSDATGLDISSLNDTVVENSSAGPSTISGTTATTTGVHPNNTLVNISGTFYIIENGSLVGVTNPGILNSLGYAFSDAVTGTSADAALPHGANAEPADGALVKTVSNPTIYVIADQQRHGFTDPSVFFGLGYEYSFVLTVTTPELNNLAVGSVFSSPTVRHLRGADVSSDGTVYWLDDTSRHPYASESDYNTWHIADDFSTVATANSADLALPMGAAIIPRVK